ATSVVTLVDSTVSITRSQGTGQRVLLFANDPGGVCFFTNSNSVLEGVSTNGSFVAMAGGTDARVSYVQTGGGARLTSPGELRLGDGANAVVEFVQSGGRVEAAQYLWLAPSASATVEYRLAGGTLAARGLKGGSGTGGSLVFAGGTYAAAPNADAIQEPSNLRFLFEAGSQAVFDTAGRTLFFPTAQSPEGVGGLTKQGAGALRIPGTYTGPTVVEAGTLVLYQTAASPAYTVAEGATLLFDGLSGVVPVNSLALDGTLAFNTTASGLGMAGLSLSGAPVTLGANAAIAFSAGLTLQPGTSYTFLNTDNAALGAAALAAQNVPSGWHIAQSGTAYSLTETVPSVPPLGRNDVIIRLSRETIEALPINTPLAQAGAFFGSGVIVSNAPRNDLNAEVSALYFVGNTAQAMHGPAVPAEIVGNNTWSASMWVWSGNRLNNEPTVVCWGMRKGDNRQNCSLNHASTESRAASFFGIDPRYTAGAPALDAWQHIVFSYSGATTGQGLTVYVNGEPRSLNLDVNSLIIPDDGQSILLGSQHDGTPRGITARPYEGFLGELVIFGGTLTQAEAEQLYTAGVPRYVGSSALPDEDQVFEASVFTNWLDADGWRNHTVPFNNSALVTGPGVSATVDSQVPVFKNLRVENGAAVHVSGTTFRPDGLVAVSNGASLAVTDGGLFDPAGHVYLGGGGRLTVSGEQSRLTIQASGTPLRIGNETPQLSALAILDGARVSVPNNHMQVSYNTKTVPGNGLVALTNGILTVSSMTTPANLYVGRESGEGSLIAVSSTVSVVNGSLYLSSSGDAATAHATLLLDHSVLTVGTTFGLGWCESASLYRSLNSADATVRNGSSVTVTGEFILGNRNAASDDGRPMTRNTPAVLTLDGSTLTLNNWGTVARQNGLGTLLVTNNAQVIKRGVNHFRIGSDGNTAANQGANTNPYSEGRVHISAGGLLELQSQTNELRIAWGAA
ncbi:MAG: autotransporter-associated beta strand repeat-containing protein, partial [Verrucomicrobiota bacterium]|nr:autotransporter-associated beta strand repeat-containing protein [Verrucomicrobiota bacterium]